MPETTGNIRDAQRTDHRPARLTRWKGRTRTRPPWYNATTTCNRGARAVFAAGHAGDNGVCDEYPFNSTSENQQTIASVTLKLVPGAEGAIQRDALNRFYRSTCRVGEGSNSSDFVVIPVPSQVPVPSFGFCPTR